MSTSTFKDLSTTKITQALLRGKPWLERTLYLEFDFDYEASRIAALEIEKIFQNNKDTYENYPFFRTKEELIRLPLYLLLFANGGTYPRTKASRAKLFIHPSSTFQPQNKREYIFFLDTLFLPIRKAPATFAPNKNNPKESLKAILPWARMFQWNHTSGMVQWIEGYLYKHDIPPTKPNDQATVKIHL